VSNEISEVTRRAIVDFLATSGTDWAGRLREDDFLARLYDLTSMPSKDYRVRNAAGDIHQHRVNWRDWEDDWVFYDSRFNLMYAPDEQFLRFLCETVHPVVRPDPDSVRDLVATYNRELGTDGWSLVEVKQISGRPVFAPQKTGQRAQVFEEPTGWQKVDRQLQEVRLRLDTAGSEEQYQAIGLLCREVLISVAQEVYDPARHTPHDGVAPSNTDAKRMLEAFFGNELQGGADEEARAHARAALRLALALQHKRTADFRMAALCAEATSSVVNILAVLAGRRGRSF
jgi:AbiJ-like protein